MPSLRGSLSDTWSCQHKPISTGQAAPLWSGTRIPVAALFENLEDGVSLTEFVELFPGFSDQQARQVLEHVARSTAAVVA